MKAMETMMKTNKSKLCIIAADMQHFKELTTGHTVVMGRKTYQSIGKALPGRRNIVISGQKLDLPGCEAMTLNEFMQPSIDDTVYVIGGAKLFSALLPLADAMHITVIHDYSKGDTCMPMHNYKWNITAIEQHKADADNKFDYDFITYERVQDKEFDSIRSYCRMVSVMGIVDERPTNNCNQFYNNVKRQCKHKHKHNNNQSNNHGKES